MMKITRYLVLASLVGSLGVPASQAAMFSLVGAGDFANESPSVTSKLAFGGGMLIDSWIGPGTSFEFGALYLTRKFEQNSAGSDDVTSTMHEIQIPVLLKFRLLPMIHIGVGGYYAAGLGSIDNEDATTPSSSNSNQTFSGAGLKSSDYGLLGTAGLSLPLGHGGTHFLVEARYAYGLENVSTTGTTHNRDVEVLAGFSFPFGMHGR